MASKERSQVLAADTKDSDMESMGAGTTGSLSRMFNMVELMKPSKDEESGKDETDQGAEKEKKIRVPCLPYVGGASAYISELESERVKESCGAGVSFFPNDKVRRVDYVLVWSKDSNDSEKQTKQRRVFEAWLRRHRLQMVDTVSTGDSNRHFVLLHAPKELVQDKAEQMHIKMTVKKYQSDEDHFSRKVFSLCGSDPLNNHIDEQTMSVASPFTKTLFGRGRYQNSSNFEKFFTVGQRARIVHQILTETPFGNEPSEIGIEQLLEGGSYEAAFPLHEGKDELPEEWDGNSVLLSPRQRLRQYWSRWGCWYRYQPLDHIKDYFGVQIALYFAWLGFYTAWLLPAAIVGVIVFAVGLITLFFDGEIKEVCMQGKHMCPLCDGNGSHCQAWNLSTACGLFKMEYMFDNIGTVLFAIFMALWATLFLEFWKRQNAILAFRWNTMDFEEAEEPIRAQYSMKATERRKNPITHVMEPHMPESKRYPRYLTSFSILMALITMVAISIIAVMVYRTFSAKLFGKGVGKTVASISASVLQVVVIIILSKVYEKLATVLTEWENHRTESAFQDNLTLKRFLFEFSNYYSSIFYIAFFKGRWLGKPGHWAINIFRFHPEQCSAAGCMQELAQQLAIIMVGKQIINNVLEFILPQLKLIMARRKHHKQAESAGGEGDAEGLIHSAADNEVYQWEEDMDLEPDEGLFGEYLEMVLQFGFITIFVAAFPLAPLFALLNNWIEIRLDAHNYVSAMRRPVPELAQDIGIWFTILDMLVKIAIVCSAFIIAFTSTFIDRIFYAVHFNPDMSGITNFTHSLISGSVNGSGLGYDCWFKGYHDYYGQRTIEYWHLVALRVAFVVVFEHVAFILANALDVLIPDIPKSLDQKIKREAYLAQRDLEDLMAGEKDEESGEEATA